MCGRFSLYTIAEILTDRFDADLENPLRKRYNIAPSQETAVILNSNPKTISFAKWGLVPSWAKDAKIGYKMINARAETVAEKPAYRSAYKNRRCLVLADGFYEWSNKQPYRIELKDGSPFAFAGLWETWQDQKTFSIVTVEPNAQMKDIHDRMPVIIPKGLESDWLGNSPEKIMKPYPGALEIFKVSTKINSPSNDDESVIQRMKDLADWS